MNYTDEELIRDLRVWTNISEYTDKSPYVIHVFLKQILDLINRIRIENKQLKDEIERINNKPSVFEVLEKVRDKSQAVDTGPFDYHWIISEEELQKIEDSWLPGGEE